MGVGEGPAGLNLLEAWGAKGLLGLFAAAFLAGGVLPAPSEAALVAAIAVGYEPWLSVGVATLGNVLGATTIFALTRWLAGREGERVTGFLERRTRADRQRVERALLAVRRYGALILLLSWVPVVGDALVAAGGLVRVGWLPFFVFVTAGKAARYALVAAGAVALTRAAG